MADFTCALATGECQSMATSVPPRTVIGACPAVVSMMACMARSGSATRSIGRRRSEASPSSTTMPAPPAARPATRRMVVPELAQSIATRSLTPRSGPWPWMRRAPSCSETCAPRVCTAASVARTSAPPGTPLSTVVPSARAPRRSARCAIDLSPGRSSPPVRPAGGGATRTGRITPCARGDVAPPAPA